MFRQHKNLVPGLVILLVLLLLAGCSSANNSSITNSSTQSSTTAPISTTPQLITPRSASGSPGKGPIIISSPTTLPGAKPGTQQVVLRDRRLIIARVTVQNGTNSNSSLIALDLAVQNTSPKAIMNLSNFYQLMGPDGDAFGYQYNSSDTFYGPIAAFQTRTGTIMFEVPKAAISSLQLLYRPEIATETVIIRLKTS